MSKHDRFRNSWRAIGLGNYDLAPCANRSEQGGTIAREYRGFLPLQNY